MYSLEVKPQAQGLRRWRGILLMEEGGGERIRLQGIMGCLVLLASHFQEDV